MRRWLKSAVLALGLSVAMVAHATPPSVGINYTLTPGQQAWVDSIGKKFSKCDILGGAFASFPEYPYLPDPQDWFGLVELPTDTVGSEVYVHNLVIHTASNSAYLFTAGGPNPSMTRGPIPLNFECTKLRGQGKKRAARRH